MPRSGIITIDRPGGLQTIEDASKIPRNRATVSLNSLSRSAMARQVGGFKKWNGASFGSAGSPVQFVHPCSFVDQATVASHVVAQRGADLVDVAASGASTTIHTWATAGLVPSAAWFDDIQIFAQRDHAGNAGAIQQWTGGASTQAITAAGGVLATFPDPGAGTNPLEDIRPAIIFSTGKGPGAGTVGGQQASPDTHLFALDFVDMNGGGAGVKSYHRNWLAFVDLSKPPTGVVEWKYAVVGGGREGDKNYCVAGAVFGAHVFVWRAFGDLYRYRYVVDPNFLAGAGSDVGFYGEHIPFFEEGVGHRGIVKTPGPLFFPCRSGIWALIDPDTPRPVKASRVLEGPGGIWEQVNAAALDQVVGAYDPVRRIAVWQMPFGSATTPGHWLVLELPDRDVDLADFSKYEWHVFERYSSYLAYMSQDPAGGEGTLIYGTGVDAGYVWAEDDTMLQGGSEATESGTVLDSVGLLAANNLVDDAAAFSATAIGRPLVFFDDTSDHQELGFVTAQTGTTLTVAQDWQVQPTEGAAYVLGGLQWEWRSKKFKPQAGLQWFERFIGQMQVLGSGTVRLYAWKDNETDPVRRDFTFSGGVSLPDFVLSTSALSGSTGSMQDVEGFIDSTADRIQIGLKSYGSGTRTSLVTAELSWTQESMELDR